MRPTWQARQKGVLHDCAVNGEVNKERVGERENKRRTNKAPGDVKCVPTICGVAQGGCKCPRKSRPPPPPSVQKGAHGCAMDVSFPLLPLMPTPTTAPPAGSAAIFALSECANESVRCVTRDLAPWFVPLAAPSVTMTSTFFVLLRPLLPAGCRISSARRTASHVGVCPHPPHGYAKGTADVRVGPTDVCAGHGHGQAM